MIQDKDFTIRLIRQFIQALDKLILGKPEESLMQKDLDFDSLLKDIFHLQFDDLNELSNEEINELVFQHEDKNQKEYYQLLGNLFYFKGKEEQNKGFLVRSRHFYKLYLEKSKIFSLPIINRISEIDKIL